MWLLTYNSVGLKSHFFRISKLDTYSYKKVFDLFCRFICLGVVNQSSLFVLIVIQNPLQINKYNSMKDFFRNLRKSFKRNLNEWYMSTCLKDHFKIKMRYVFKNFSLNWKKIDIIRLLISLKSRHMLRRLVSINGFLFS